MKPFIAATLLTLSCASLLFGCGARGIATPDAGSCNRFCATQDGQTGTFDEATKSCTCSEIGTPEG